MTTSEQETKETQPISWEEFLTSYPPGKWYPILNLVRVEPVYDAAVYRLNKSDIKLYCDNERCNGPRFFRNEYGVERVEVGKRYLENIEFRCRNCQRSLKTYSIILICPGEGTRGNAVKIGEWPPFGPRVPARVLRLIQDDKDVFLMGRRSENQGMGIGAFAYYRRVVENQKTRIIDEIVRVAKRIGAPDDTIKKLEAAKTEKQFSNAVDSIKEAIPQPLLIDGHHNPLILLHDALSKGIHAKTDEECLEIATAIRVVLTDLAERIGQALKKKAELGDAVKRLMGSGSNKGNK
jgi:hypothetical protein